MSAALAYQSIQVALADVEEAVFRLLSPKERGTGAEVHAAILEARKRGAVDAEIRAAKKRGAHRGYLDQRAVREERARRGR